MGSAHPAFCPDDGPLALDHLRDCARRLGALRAESRGWFGELVQARMRRSLAERSSFPWEQTYPALGVDERAERHVASAARRAALCGGLSAVGAHVGEAVTLLTEGLAAPLCVPAVVASIAGEVVACAKVQIDLVFDLASIYGVAFDPEDTAELASIFELALRGGRDGGAEPQAAGPTAEDALLARLGRGLLEDAMLGLVPFVGIPFNAVSNYRATLRVGASARKSLRRRLALRDALGGDAFRAAPALLLEGAWLLATVDGVATQEELLVVAAVARALVPDTRRVLERLHACDERRWLERVGALDDRERAALHDALCITAALRGPTRHPERCFLVRAGDALRLPVDFARIEATRDRLWCASS